MLGRIAAFLLTLLITMQTAFATVLNVGTSISSNWVVTGGGASDAPAFQVDPVDIGITSNALSSGTFANGGTLSQFNGFWYADLTFFLPSNATGVSLSFSGLFADDRAVLQLNGTNLGDYFLNDGNPPLTGVGVMRFPGETSDEPYDFTGTTSGVISSGFLPGMENDLRLVVNNTGKNSLTTPTITFSSSGDYSDVGVIASVTYTSVPEPAAIALFAASGFALLGRRRRN